MSMPRETLLRLRATVQQQRDEAVRVFDHDLEQIDAELRRLDNSTTTPRRDRGPSVTVTDHTSMVEPATARVAAQDLDTSLPRGREGVAHVLREAGQGVVVADEDLLDRMTSLGIGPETDGDRSAQLNAVRASANRLVRWKPEEYGRVRGPQESGYRYIGDSSASADDAGKED